MSAPSGVTGPPCHTPAPGATGRETSATVRAGRAGPGAVAAPDGDRLAAGVLACLPEMTPARLRRLLAAPGGPARALRAVREGRAHRVLMASASRAPGGGGRLPGTGEDEGCGPATGPIPARAGGHGEAGPDQLVQLARRWAALDLDALADRLRSRGTSIHLATDPDGPLPDDVAEAPAVLLAEGDRPGVWAAPRVAVVGTRAASPHGLADAAELGAALAAAGVVVVSGLAVGIDAAAHQGALDAGGGVIGVLATGLDVVYPRRHGPLHARVRAAGMLCTEAGFGTPPDAFRFPVRNRIIAGIADVVVVVEARTRGGAMITARLALEYGRTVFALPGSRRNPAAAGTNALLAEGPVVPLLAPDDVLVALGMTAGARRGCRDRRPPPGSPDGRAVLAALAGEAADPDAICHRTGLAIERVLAAVAELRRCGHVTRERGLIWPC